MDKSEGELRNEFKLLLEQKETLRKELFQIREGANAAYNEALKVEYHKLYPKRKFIMDKAWGVLGEVAVAIKRQHSEEANRKIRENEKKRDDVERRLFEIAGELRELPVSSGQASEWLLYDSVSECSYHTQGFGARKYAENAAQQYVDKAEANGVRAEIREIVTTHDDHRGHKNSFADFQVWVCCSQDGLNILRYKPQIELREWVRLCWKRGSNPRVYNPWLPHEYEEKNGLDYFGNDLRKKESKTA